MKTKSNIRKKTVMNHTPTTMQLVIMAEIKNAPRSRSYSYEIAARIESDRCSVSKILCRLEQKRLICRTKKRKTSSAFPERKYFRLTRLGEREFEKMKNL